MNTASAASAVSGTKIPVEPEFQDASDITGWARSYVEAAAAAGILSGYGDGTFRPAEAVTRAEAAAMICRLLGGLQ